MLFVSSLAGCPYKGMRYYIQGECAPCFGTCEEPNVPCPLICGPGCACPPGTVLHEGECIPTEKCPKKDIGETSKEAGQTNLRQVYRTACCIAAKVRSSLSFGYLVTILYGTRTENRERL